MLVTHVYPIKTSEDTVLKKPPALAMAILEPRPFWHP